MTNSLHEAFSWVLFQTMPGVPAEAVVFEVDAGHPVRPSVVIRAAVFEGGPDMTGAMMAGPFEKIIAKDWIAEQARLREKRSQA